MQTAEATITCRRCGETKVEAEFQPSQRTTSRWCRSCRRAYEREYTATHPADRARRTRAENRRQQRKVEADPLWRRKQHLLHQYGITFERYREMVAAQDGKCAVCLIEPNVFHVDHDHRCCSGPKSCGQCVRGLLCQDCNHLLGNARDDSERLMAAAAYLIEWGGQ